jgi:hypothetical protein
VSRRIFLIGVFGHALGRVLTYLSMLIECYGMSVEIELETGVKAKYKDC